MGGEEDLRYAFPVADLPFLIRNGIPLSGSLIGSVVGAPCAWESEAAERAVGDLPHAHARYHISVFLHLPLLFFLLYPWMLMMSLIHWCPYGFVLLISSL